MVKRSGHPLRKALSPVSSSISPRKDSDERIVEDCTEGARKCPWGIRNSTCHPVRTLTPRQKSLKCTPDLAFDSYDVTTPNPPRAHLKIVLLSESMSIYSPYLNFDPAYIDASNPEYILQEGAGPRRGRFDLCFAQIGSCIAGGAAFGGVRGLLHGLGETRDLQGSVKRSQLINYTMKSGSSIAQQLGCISVMYSAFGVLFSHVREKDDDWNTGERFATAEEYP